MTPKLTSDWSDAALRAYAEGCRSLRTDPRYMLPVHIFESGMRASAENASSHASGICQTMPLNLPAVGWGKVPSELASDFAKAKTTGKWSPEITTWLVNNAASYRKLSNAAQLPYVFNFYRPYAGKMTSPTACYLATFAPAYIGHANDPFFVIYPAGSNAAALNKALDHGSKGYIEVQDLSLTISNVPNGPNGARYREFMERLEEVDPGPDPATRSNQRAFATLAVLAFIVGTGLAVHAAYSYAAEHGKLPAFAR